MSKKRKRMTLAETIRKAIKDQPVSAYRLNIETGVSQPLISRFIKGERTITIETADKLMAYLGLEVRSRDE